MTESTFTTPHSIADIESVNILRCLAPCEECTRQYVSEVLHKRFLCKCNCHLGSPVKETHTLKHKLG